MVAGASIEAENVNTGVFCAGVGDRVQEMPLGVG